VIELGRELAKSREHRLRLGKPAEVVEVLDEVEVKNPQQTRITAAVDEGSGAA
jgi:hypothetical protein